MPRQTDRISIAGVGADFAPAHRVDLIADQVPREAHSL